LQHAENRGDDTKDQIFSILTSAVNTYGAQSTQAHTPGHGGGQQGTDTQTGTDTQSTTAGNGRQTQQPTGGQQSADDSDRSDHDQDSQTADAGHSHGHGFIDYQKLLELRREAKAKRKQLRNAKWNHFFDTLKPRALLIWSNLPETIWGWRKYINIFGPDFMLWYKKGGSSSHSSGGSHHH
jgi:hypothetical protein